MLNLFLLSGTQQLLDQFLLSVLPTIDNTVKIYAITEKLRLPENNKIIRIDRTEFHPNKYFNLAYKLINYDDYIGIVNDDILFSRNWLDDIKRYMYKETCFCPGFIETKDTDLFHKRVVNTSERVGLTEGMFDAFYIFSARIPQILGGFDEDVVEWYDIDWYLKTVKANYKWFTSTKVTVQHLARMTINKAALDKRKIAGDIRKKYGKTGLNRVNKNAILLRERINEK